MSEQPRRHYNLLAHREEYFEPSTERLQLALDLQYMVDTILDHDDLAVRHRSYQRRDEGSEEKVGVSITDAYLAVFDTSGELPKFHNMYYVKREEFSNGSLQYMVESGALKAIYSPHDSGLIAKMTMLTDNNGQPELAYVQSVNQPATTSSESLNPLVGPRQPASAEWLQSLTRGLAGNNDQLQFFDTERAVIKSTENGDHIVDKNVKEKVHRFSRTIGRFLHPGRAA